MKRLGTHLSRFRKAVLMWASMWMLAVPLFHVHPEADHHHGATGHVHGGIVHTVLSRDLDCESSSHQEVTGSGEAADEGVSLSTGQVHPWNEHPEFGFSFLSDSTDRKSFKPLLTQVVCVAFALTSDLEPQDRVEQNSTFAPSPTLFIHDVPSRAPPTLLI